MPISVASPIEQSRLVPPLRGLVRVALQVQGCGPGEIAIVLSDDARLRELNRGYRGIARTTDVLSFEYGDVKEAGIPPARQASREMSGEMSHEMLPGTPHRARPRQSVVPKVHGDIVISLDRVTVQARRFRVSRGQELARLVVHGVLHLSGLDHHSAGERRHMRARETQALRDGRAFTRALERVVDRAAFLTRLRRGTASGRLT